MVTLAIVPGNQVIELRCPIESFIHRRRDGISQRVAIGPQADLEPAREQRSIFFRLDLWEWTRH